jgi:ketosteroid isomerase-like protein
MTALIEELKSRVEKFVRSFNDGDAAGVAEVYHPDGCVMSPDREPIRGRVAIEENLKRDLADGMKGLQIRTAEVHDAGEWAIECGRYEMQDASGTPISGAYQFTWRKCGSQWHIYSDCFNILKHSPTEEAQKS